MRYFGFFNRLSRARSRYAELRDIPTAFAAALTVCVAASSRRNIAILALVQRSERVEGEEERRSGFGVVMRWRITHLVCCRKGDWGAKARCERVSTLHSQS